MFDRRFYSSKLGQAAIASTLAMVAFIALSTQMSATPAMASVAAYQTVEIA